jgi:hypothetical protein
VFSAIYFDVCRPAMEKILGCEDSLLEVEAAEAEVFVIEYFCFCCNDGHYYCF